MAGGVTTAVPFSKISCLLYRVLSLFVVMRGLDPRIHTFRHAEALQSSVDPRVKPGGDGLYWDDWKDENAANQLKPYSRGTSPGMTNW